MHAVHEDVNIKDIWLNHNLGHQFYDANIRSARNVCKLKAQTKLKLRHLEFYCHSRLHLGFWQVLTC